MPVLRPSAKRLRLRRRLRRPAGACPGLGTWSGGSEAPWLRPPPFWPGSMPSWPSSRRSGPRWRPIGHSRNLPRRPNGAGETTFVRLRAAAVELGARISGDDRVGEPDAAKLLGHMRCAPMRRTRAHRRAASNRRTCVRGEPRPMPAPRIRKATCSFDFSSIRCSVAGHRIRAVSILLQRGIALAPPIWGRRVAGHQLRCKRNWCRRSETPARKRHSRPSLKRWLHQSLRLASFLPSSRGLAPPLCLRERRNARYSKTGQKKIFLPQTPTSRLLRLLELSFDEGTDLWWTPA